jgi:fatty acid desaturase
MTTENERPDPSIPAAPAEAPAGVPRPSLEERAEGLAREAEAAAARLAASPTARATGDLAARVWGLVLLLAGLWLLARFTLHLAVPDIVWEEVWPAAIILLGLLVLLRAGRRA